MPEYLVTCPMQMPGMTLSLCNNHNQKRAFIVKIGADAAGRIDMAIVFGLKYICKTFFRP